MLYIGLIFSLALLHCPHQSIKQELPQLNIDFAMNAQLVLLDDDSIIFQRFASIMLGWSDTSSMHIERYESISAVLTNGKVLMIGGANNRGILNSTELHDPLSGTWTIVNSMNDIRFLQAVSVLLDGIVLVTGGEDARVGPLNTSELYDPSTNMWTTDSTQSDKPLKITR
ncbi:unnamed protein product [Rotaria socialis]|uniref:Uncharacterized protein n=4 Tax=Rotaria TaxID=231623 RepID=A0A820ZZG8_9BILA|nr:unnamed protein product [Rotaria socialis]